MKTLQKTLMIAALLLAGASSAHAQYDTTAWPDPWYLYQPKYDCALTNPRAVFKTQADSNNYCYSVPQHLINSVYYVTEDITVYGIAITTDTQHIYDYEDHPDLNYPSDTGFFARLYVPDDSAPGVTSGVKVKTVDKVSFFNCVVPGYQEEHRRVRHTKFRYDCDTLVDNMVANCWEFYFNEPHHFSEGDSFYVGHHYSTSNFFFHPCFVVCAEKDKPTNTYADQSGYFQYRNHGSFEALYFWPHYYKYWGCLFPIVGLRCTEPRGLKLERKDGDTAVFSWPGYNQAESYEVLVVNDSTGDSTVHYLTPDDTSFTLTGIDSLQQYRVRVRKSCRYSTEGYDSIVVSGWSDAVTLEAKTPPDTTATDTTWIHRVDGADFTLKPNPARGRCLLQLGSAAADGCEVEVTDMRGVSVLRRRLEPGARTTELDIATLPAGAYMVKLVTPQGIASRRLLVR